MEPPSEALRLLRRQSELEGAMRRPGGIRVTEERELYQLRDNLQNSATAVRTSLGASKHLHRPLDAP